MKERAHILVVEDKSLIYKRLKMILKEHYYSVDNYTPSVKEAIGNINKKRPDLVLLDIDLQGEHKGTYLGELLSNEYNIPFIYVTDFDDDRTFYEGLKTKQSDFISKKSINLSDAYMYSPIVINTKPHLDEKRLIRSIQTVLELYKKEHTSVIKDNVMAFVDLPKNLHDTGATEVSQRPVKHDDIEFFTSKIIDIDSDNLIKERVEELKKEGRNIAKFTTINKEVFYYRGNLSTILTELPHNFVKINKSEIVNITVKSFDGRINGRRLVIGNKIYNISDTYKKEVEKRMDHFY